MAFVPGFRSRLNVGEFAWSAYTVGYSAAVARKMLDSTTLADDGDAAFIPGTLSSNATVDMILDTAYAASSQFATMNTWITTAQVVTIAPSGFTRGNECWLVSSLASTAKVGASNSDKVTAGLSLTNDGPADFGVVLDDWTTITADTDGTSTDNGASTANGGVAHLHVSAFSGLTSDSVIIEHSTNDSVWATLGTFSSVTAVGAERIVIAAGTTVNRYLRVRDDATGTGSITRQVSFGRR